MRNIVTVMFFMLLMAVFQSVVSAVEIDKRTSQLYVPKSSDCLFGSGDFVKRSVRQMDVPPVKKERFDSVSAVRKAFVLSRDEWEMNWEDCINSHGQKTVSEWSTTVLWSNGTWSRSWGGHSRKNCGTVFVIPVSGFFVEREFSYKDYSGGEKEGMIVAVEISIICTDPNLSNYICRRAVHNYVERGVNVPRIDSYEKPTSLCGRLPHGRDIRLPSSRAFRPGKLLSFKEAVRKRFGADSCMYLEGDSADGRVRVLALGCNSKKERVEISPQTYQ